MIHSSEYLFMRLINRKLEQQVGGACFLRTAILVLSALSDITQSRA